MRYVFVATRETGGLGPSRGEGSRARRAALQQVRSARVREAVVAARDALDRHSGQAALKRPISQYARDGIDRSYVDRAANPDLGGVYAETGGLQSVRCLT
jgi:hypothetical protein